MCNFIITTDSSCDLPEALCAKMKIFPIFMKYTIDGQAFSDSLNVEKKKKFFDIMRTGKMPTTSAINPGEYSDFWKDLYNKYKLPIVHISLCQELSCTCNNAVMAANMLKDEIPDAQVYVVDSFIASLGQGMQVLFAANLRDSGVTAEKCARQLDICKRHVNTLYTTGDLKYFLAGGRLSRLGAAFGTVLNINPILNCDPEGALKVIVKPRGENGALKKVCEIIGNRAINPEEQTIFICHTDCPDKAKLFATALCEQVGFKNVFFSTMGATIGSHCGPGLVAIFYMGKERGTEDTSAPSVDDGIAVITSPEFQQAFADYFLTRSSGFKKMDN